MIGDIGFSGLAIAALVGILLNAIIPPGVTASDETDQKIDENKSKQKVII